MFNVVRPFHFVQTEKSPRWDWFHRFATATVRTNWVSLAKYHNNRVLLSYGSKWVAFTLLSFSFSVLILHLSLLQLKNKRTRKHLIFLDRGLIKAVFLLAMIPGPTASSIVTSFKCVVISSLIVSHTLQRFDRSAERCSPTALWQTALRMGKFGRVKGAIGTMLYWCHVTFHLFHGNVFKPF